ncbi:MAG: Acetoacetyl-CoA synthetase, partial [uncultured Thermomicrobiales bacterium]
GNARRRVRRQECCRRRRRLDPNQGVPGPEPPRALHRACRDARLRRPAPPRRRRPGLVLGGRGARPGAGVGRALRAGARPERRSGLAALVPRRPVQLRPECGRPPRGRRRRRSARPHLGRGRRQRPAADLPRVGDGDGATRQRAAGARRRPGRPGRHLSADAARDGDRDPRLRQARRRLPADVLRLRRGRRRRPPPRRRGDRPDHGGRRPPPRRGRPHEARRRRGARRRPAGPPLPRPPTHWRGRALDLRPRRLVARRRRGRVARLPDRRYRRRRPLHDHPHLRHDRPAEGGGPRPRRVPDQGRPRPRLLLRPPGRRHPLLAD